MSDPALAAELDNAFSQLHVECQKRLQSVSKLVKVRASAWLAQMREPATNVVWKRNRNQFARLLLDQLTHNGTLEAPFDVLPPEGGLPTMQPWMLYRQPTRRRAGSPSPRERQGGRDQFESVGHSKLTLGVAGQWKGDASQRSHSAQAGPGDRYIPAVRHIATSPHMPGWQPGSPGAWGRVEATLHGMQGVTSHMEHRLRAAEEEVARTQRQLAAAQQKATRAKSACDPLSQLNSKSPARQAAKAHLDAVISKFEERRRQWQMEDAVAAAAGHTGFAAWSATRTPSPGTTPRPTSPATQPAGRRSSSRAEQQQFTHTAGAAWPSSRASREVTLNAQQGTLDTSPVPNLGLPYQSPAPSTLPAQQTPTPVARTRSAGLAQRLVGTPETMGGGIGQGEGARGEGADPLVPYTPSSADSTPQLQHISGGTGGALLLTPLVTRSTGSSSAASPRTTQPPQTSSTTMSPSQPSSRRLLRPVPLPAWPAADSARSTPHLAAPRVTPRGMRATPVHVPLGEPAWQHTPAPDNDSNSLGGGRDGGGTPGWAGGGGKTAQHVGALVDRLLSPAVGHETHCVTPSGMSVASVATGAGRGAVWSPPRSVGGCSARSVPASVRLATAMEQRSEDLRVRLQQQRAAGEVAEAAVQAALQALASQRLTVLHAQAELEHHLTPLVTHPVGPLKPQGPWPRVGLSQRVLQVLGVAFAACLSDIAAAVGHLDRCPTQPVSPRRQRARTPSPGRASGAWGSHHRRTDIVSAALQPAEQQVWRHGGKSPPPRRAGRACSVSPLRPAGGTLPGSVPPAVRHGSPLSRKGLQGPALPPASLLSLCTLACMHSTRQLVSSIDRMVLKPVVVEQQRLESEEDLEAALPLAEVAELVAGHIAQLEEGARDLQAELRRCLQVVEESVAQQHGGSFGSPAVGSPMSDVWDGGSKSGLSTPQPSVPLGSSLNTPRSSPPGSPGSAFHARPDSPFAAPASVHSHRSPPHSPARSGMGHRSRPGSPVDVLGTRHGGSPRSHAGTPGGSTWADAGTGFDIDAEGGDLGAEEAVWDGIDSTCGVFSTQTLLPESVQASLAEDWAGFDSCDGSGGNSSGGSVGLRGWPSISTQATTHSEPGPAEAAGGTQASRRSPPGSPAAASPRGGSPPMSARRLAHELMQSPPGSPRVGGAAAATREVLERALTHQVATALAAVARARDAAVGARDPLAVAVTHSMTLPAHEPLLPPAVFESLRFQPERTSGHLTRTAGRAQSAATAVGTLPVLVAASNTTAVPGVSTSVPVVRPPSDAPPVTSQPREGLMLGCPPGAAHAAVSCAAGAVTVTAPHITVSVQPAAESPAVSPRQAQAMPSQGLTAVVSATSSPSKLQITAHGVAPAPASLPLLQAAGAPPAVAGAPAVSPAVAGPATEGSAVCCVSARPAAVPVVEDLNRDYRKGVGVLRAGCAENQRLWEEFQRRKRDLGLTDG